MSPVSAAPDKPAKSSKATKGKKKAKKKGKKSKKGRKAKKDKAKVADMLISEADMTCSLDTVFNRCMQNVLDGKYGPEDERVCGKSLLWYAAGRGLLPAVKYLVENGADTRTSADTQQTIVSQAALSGNVELLRYLQDAGVVRQLGWHQRVKVDEKAAESGNIEMLKAAREALGAYRPTAQRGFTQSILSGNVECMEFASSGSSWEKDICLMLAAHSGSMEMVKAVEKRCPDASVVDSQQATMMMHAARSGNLELVKYAESKGCDPKASNNWKDSTMVFAAASGSLECVKYLVEKKQLDIFADSLRFENSYIHAGLSGNAELVEYMVKKNKAHAGRALLGAAYHGHFDLVKMLVEKYQADVNSNGYVVDSEMLHFNMDASYLKSMLMNVLCAAVYSGNIELVQYLLDKGADVHSRNIGMRAPFGDKGYNAALMYAALGGQPEMMKLLAKHGADVESVKNNMLRDSAMSGNIGCLKFLIEELGADANADTNCTPLQAACMFNASGDFKRWSYDTGSSHADCVRYLLEKGADPSKTSQYTRSTPFVIASYFEQIDSIVALVEAKADYSDCNYSPMALAGKLGRVDCIQQLLKLGEKIDKAGKNGHTALDEAAMCYADPDGSYEECVKFLISEGALFDGSKLEEVQCESIRKLVEKKLRN